MGYFLELDKDIKSIAKRRGLLIKDVQNICGINHVTFNDLRKKNDLKASQLFKICEALNAPVSAFIHNTSGNNIVKEDQQTYAAGGAAGAMQEVKHLRQLLSEKEKQIELLQKLVKTL
jgi:DNA-binding Xre family transcriptional regulator